MPCLLTGRPVNQIVQPLIVSCKIDLTAMGKTDAVSTGYAFTFVAAPTSFGAGAGELRDDQEEEAKRCSTNARSVLRHNGDQSPGCR